MGLKQHMRDRHGLTGDYADMTKKVGELQGKLDKVEDLMWKLEAAPSDAQYLEIAGLLRTILGMERTEAKKGDRPCFVLGSGETIDEEGNYSATCDDGLDDERSSEEVEEEALSHDEALDYEEGD
jgi:hypothetical protein